MKYPITLLFVCAALGLLDVGCSREVQSSTTSTVPDIGKAVVVETDEGTERTELRSEARRLLVAKEYGKIEQRAKELFDSKTGYPDGYWKLSGYYVGLAKPERGTSDAAYMALIAKLKTWAAEKPDSVLASIALARCWHDFALVARGSGMADTVTKAQWKIFRERLAMAHDALDLSKKNRNTSPLWYANALRIALEQEKPRAEYEQLFQEAIKAFPSYDDLYFRKAYYLTPIWYGRRDDVEKFLDEAVKSRSGEEADILYTRIVWSLREAHAYNNIYQETEISWPRVRKGFAALLRQHPDSIAVSSEFCYEALQASDRAQARQLFEEKIKDKVVASVWDTPDRFLAFREAARKN